METPPALLWLLMVLAAAPRRVLLVGLAPLALLAAWALRRRAHRRPAWDPRIAVIPLAAWALAVAVAPLAGSAATTRLVRALAAMPAAHGRTNALLRWGEAACARADMATALQRAQALPPPMRRAFLDGCGHRLAIDVTDPVATARRIETTVPHPWRLYMHEAALRRLALDADLQPEAVVSATRAYVTAAPGVDPRNAVRTALQRARGDDLEAAIALALRYPADWQPALLEELGWRAGDEQTGADAAAISAAVPAPLRCVFVRGAVRGRLLRQEADAPWTWDELAAWLAPLPACPEDQALGIAWALQIQHGGDIEEWRAAIARIPDDGLRRAVSRDTEDLLRTGDRATPSSMWQPVAAGP